MSSIQLTYDTWELITDILGDELESDRPSMLGLRNLALTCKAMVPLCRRHLLSEIRLDDYSEPHVPNNSVGRFHKLISNLAIIHHIRHLHLAIWFPDDVRLQEILDVLCSSASLRSIYLVGRGRDWNTFPRSFQVLMDRLIHQPTVTKLDISTLKFVPMSVFLSSTNVTHVNLNNVQFTHDDDSDVDIANRVASPTLKPKYLYASTRSYEGLWTLMQPSGQTQDKRTIDFSGLQEGEFWGVDNAGDMEIVHQVLYNSKELQSLDINLDTPLSWTGLGACLSAHVRTLRSVALGPYVDSEGDDPLRDLVPELGVISGMNILEEVSLFVIIQGETAYRVDTGDWLGFDSLLTRPGSFPMLQKVTIEILWVAWGGDEKEIEARITKQNFPNLLDSKAFEFKFSSSVHWM